MHEAAMTCHGAGMPQLKSISCQSPLQTNVHIAPLLPVQRMHSVRYSLAQQIHLCQRMSHFVVIVAIKGTLP